MLKCFKIRGNLRKKKEKKKKKKERKMIKIKKKEGNINECRIALCKSHDLNIDHTQKNKTNLYLWIL
jgi:hypothetical protein